jgi:hypothetical protein
MGRSGICGPHILSHSLAKSPCLDLFGQGQAAIPSAHYE